MAPPTSLPGASTLAQLLFDTLKIDVPMPGVDSTNLLAVADTIAAHRRGADLLRQTILGVADFRSALFNYAHEVLALLLCEGAICILETNYDDCIERAAQPERPMVIRTADEMLAVAQASIFKIHGCATVPNTMLVTTRDLDSVDSWATSQFESRMWSSRVAFIGIGSPADYVRSNIAELMSIIGTDHLLVVDPCLASWDGLEPPAWKAILPTLSEDQREAQGAEEFCDSLLRAYLRFARRHVTEFVRDMSPTSEQCIGINTIFDSLNDKDAVWVMRWMREASFRIDVGTSVVKSKELTNALLACACLTGSTNFTLLLPGGWLFIEDLPAVEQEAQTPETSDRRSLPTHSNDIPILLLMAHILTRGTQINPEARRRVIRARGQGIVQAGKDVIVVAVGHTGAIGGETHVESGFRLKDVLESSSSAPSNGLPNNLIGDSNVRHLIDGPRVGSIIFIDGENLIEVE